MLAVRELPPRPPFCLGHGPRSRRAQDDDACLGRPPPSFLRSIDRSIDPPKHTCWSCVLWLGTGLDGRGAPGRGGLLGWCWMHSLLESHAASYHTPPPSTNRRHPEGRKTGQQQEQGQVCSMAKHHADLIFCRKQPGIAIGRLCEKCVLCSVAPAAAADDWTDWAGRPIDGHPPYLFTPPQARRSLRHLRRECDGGGLFECLGLGLVFPAPALRAAAGLGPGDGRLSHPRLLRSPFRPIPTELRPAVSARAHLR